MKSLSVIMLTHNREEFVSHMIEDILAQTYRDYEFIIVNNGSEDSTKDILDRYKALDKRVRILNIENSTIGRARNVGLDASEGEYVTYVDDDDRVKPDFLEFLVDLVDCNDADVAMCGATEGDGKSRKPQCLFDEKMILSGEDAVRLLLGRKYIRAGLPTKLYRKTILQRFPCVENVQNEDIHTQYKYLLASKTVAIQGMDKYYITRHANNVSGFTGNAATWTASIMRDYLCAYHSRTEYIMEKAPALYELALYSEWSFMISMIEKIHRYDLQDCEEVREKLVIELTENKSRFMSMPMIQEFEKEWIRDYISEVV